MAEKKFAPPVKLKVAIVQLECHPAFKVGASNFISEPFIDNGPRPVLQTLWDYGFDVDELQTHCRDRYLVWHRSRLLAIIEWFGRLSREDQPDIVVFPEGSIPREFLPCLRDRFADAFSGVKKTHGRSVIGTTIFAGTHAYEASSTARKVYQALGVQEQSLIRLTQKQSEAPSVMPVIHRDGRVELFPKLAPSPFERTTIGRPTSEDDLERDCIIVQTSERSVPVMALVCSEALQFSGRSGNPKPELAVILSYDARPAQFESLAHHLVANRISVAYCNDGRYGASRIFTQSDSRSENWLEQPPRHGRLPKGDAILIEEITVGDFAPQVGTSKPIMPSALIRLSSIVPENAREASFIFNESICRNHEMVRDRANSGDSIDIEQIRDELQFLSDSTGATAIQVMQLSRLLSLARNDSALPSEWNAFADNCVIGVDLYRNSIRFLTYFRTIDPASFPRRFQRSNEIPPSLHSLRRELAAHCYRRVSLLLDSFDAGDPAALLEARRRLAEFAPRALTGSAITCVVNQIRKIKEDALQLAKMRLSNSLAALVERFACTSGMLFVVHNDHHVTSRGVKLLASIMLNTPQRELERFAALRDQGIVGFVGYTKRPYLCAYVGCDPEVSQFLRDPLYVPTIGSTRSELAVPILAPSSDKANDELIGVVNLESRIAGSFTEIDISHLQSASIDLLTEIRVLQSATDSRKAISIHPAIHGWTLRGVIEKLCHEIATSFSGGERAPSISATLWTHDECKKRLWVVGTSRYDFEYITEKWLPEDSFLGSCLGKNWQVFRGALDDLPGFRKRKKAEQMELTRVAVCPFSVNGVSRSSNYILALYSFRHDVGLNETNFDSHFTDARIRRLARIFSEIIAEMMDQKRALVLSRCREVMSSGDDTLGDSIASVRSKLSEAFTADASTLFLRQDDKLVPVDSSGLEISDGSYIIPSPGLAGNEKVQASVTGFTEFLAQRPNQTLRKIDIPDPLEICCCTAGTFTIQPRNSVREKGAASASSHRGFLGGSFGCGTRVEGVVRLLRDEKSPPFSVDDELMLKEACSYLSNVFERVEGGETPAMDESLLRVFPPVGDNWVKGWLQRYQRSAEELMNGQTATLIHLRYAAKDSSLEWKLRLLACHSKSSKAVAANSHDVALRKGNLGWMSIDWKLDQIRLGSAPRLLMFEPEQCQIFDCGGIDRQGETRMGLCIPIRWTIFGNPIHGVLTVDFPHRFELNEDALGYMFARSLEIQCMGMGDTGHGINDSFHLIRDKAGFDTSVGRIFEEHLVQPTEFPLDDKWLDSRSMPPPFRPISMRQLRWDLRFTVLESQNRSDHHFHKEDVRRIAFNLYIGAFPAAQFVGTLRNDVYEQLRRNAREKAVQLNDESTSIALVSEHGISIEWLLLKKEFSFVFQYVTACWTHLLTNRAQGIDWNQVAFDSDRSIEGIVAYSPKLTELWKSVY